MDTNNHVNTDGRLLCLRQVFLFISLSLSLSACASSHNISNRDPFYDYVGKTVELRRPVSVIHRIGLWSDYGVMSIHKAQYGLIEKGTEWQGRGEYGQYGPVLGELPVGHKVRIDKVYDEIVGDEEQIIAYGHTTIDDEEVSFAYPWGQFWVLWRAPWEPDDTPAKRGPPGKLPVHWDYDMFYPPEGTPHWGTKVKNPTEDR